MIESTWKTRRPSSIVIGEYYALRKCPFKLKVSGIVKSVEKHLFSVWEALKPKFREYSSISKFCTWCLDTNKIFTNRKIKWFRVYINIKASIYTLYTKIGSNLSQIEREDMGLLECQAMPSLSDIAHDVVLCTFSNRSVPNNGTCVVVCQGR